MDTVQDAARTDTAQPLVTVNDGEVRNHLDEVVRSAVEETVRKQVECGVDVVSDGEFGSTVTHR